MANKVVHFEIMGPDADAMKAFYSEAFGWETQSFEGMPDYYLVDAEQTGVGGAIGKGQEEMPNYLTVYLEVPDVDAHLAKIEAAGGSTVVPKQVIPGVVTFGLFADPGGNMVGVVETETPPAE